MQLSDADIAVKAEDSTLNKVKSLDVKIAELHKAINVPRIITISKLAEFQDKLDELKDTLPEDAFCNALPENIESRSLQAVATILQLHRSLCENKDEGKIGKPSLFEAT